MNYSDPDITSYYYGFTAHEHLDDFSLINMNGRMYDPIMSMFLSPDPFIQSASQTQSFNRYAYVMNNPLKFIDPSGMIKTRSDFDIDEDWEAYQDYIHTYRGWMNEMYGEGNYWFRGNPPGTWGGPGVSGGGIGGNLFWGGSLITPFTGMRRPGPGYYVMAGNKRRTLLSQAVTLPGTVEQAIGLLDVIIKSGILKAQEENEWGSTPVDFSEYSNKDRLALELMKRIKYLSEKGKLYEACLTDIVVNVTTNTRMQSIPQSKSAFYWDGYYVNMYVAQYTEDALRSNKFAYTINRNEPHWGWDPDKPISYNPQFFGFWVKSYAEYNMIIIRAFTNQTLKFLKRIYDGL